MYHVLVGLARLLTPVIARGQSKWARGMRSRGTGGRRLIEWGRATRDPDRPTVWFHASSVGETFQARAVAQALSAERPDLQVVFTYFSPSAEQVAATFGAEVWDALPWDASGPVGAVVDAIEPALLVFTQREVWPVITNAVIERGGRVALIAGTLPADAGRLKGLARNALSSTMAELSLVASIGPDDAERFQVLGTRPEAIEVTGDPGVDSARQRGRGTIDARHLALFADAVPTIVAGSTWSADEILLCEALESYQGAEGDLRVIAAPHEPSDRAVAELSTRLNAAGWKTQTLTQAENRGTAVGAGEAIVVDRVGVLANLYSFGTVAYVGGGLGTKGLHSVLEPAAVGIPSVFGPRGHSLAASELVGGGGARVVRDTPELTRVLEEWLHEGESGDTAGAWARDYIERQSGAAERTAALLAGLLDPTI